MALTTALALTLVLGCADDASRDVPETEAAGGPDVVATYSGSAAGDRQSITIDEVDARILALPPSQRHAPGQDLDAWLRDQVRQLAVDRVLAAEALAPETERRLDALRAQAMLQIATVSCLATLRPETAEPIAAEALQAAYDETPDRWDIPERRGTHHLFVRRQPGDDAEISRREADELRDRVLAGESFQRLAKAESDSESRHLDGFIGWLQRGQLPRGFDDVVFTIDEGVPSDVVVTADGAHLFYVDKILPARRAALDEVRPGLRDMLAAERRARAIEELVADVESVDGDLAVDDEQLAAMMEEGRLEDPVLRIDDIELTLGQLQRQVVLERQRAAETDSRQTRTRPTVGSLLEQTRRRALLLRRCRAEDAVSDTTLETRLEAWNDATRRSLQRQRRLVEHAKVDSERLRGFYESNLGRFGSQVVWRLRRLTLPLDADASANMRRLEAAANLEDGVRPTLDQLRTVLGGEIDEIGPLTSNQLLLFEPKLPALVAPLAPGELSAPYRGAETLQIAELLERRDPETQDFEDVEEWVAEAYAGDHAPVLYRELEAELLDSVEFELRDAGIAALRESLAPRKDVTVEELEQLLDEL